MDNNVIAKYTVLKKKKNSDEALKLLKRVASQSFAIPQILPIVRKRGWKVRELCEFFPENPNLLGLNVNRGLKIKLRLRPSYDDTLFLEYNDLLGTMLHEGPHDAIFYKLLDELNNELDQLITNGYSGEGFYSKGHTLGQVTVSMREARQRAVIAAEKRKQIQSLMTKGGNRLGGGISPSETPRSPRDMAAQAAERRLRDQKWCGGMEEEEVDDTFIPQKRKREPDSEARKRQQPEIIDLTTDDNVTPGWVCATCTYENSESVLVCAMCLGN
ncbi:hypothetical protein DFQ28_010115 [Apophysomyces sp. BC1034]|nr:hypothetical protein DFQ28_010115 [Apophysomyces sp. BC1034]